jgi:hypothetical protein
LRPPARPWARAPSLVSRSASGCPSRTAPSDAGCAAVRSPHGEPGGEPTEKLTAGL